MYLHLLLDPLVIDFDIQQLLQPLLQLVLGLATPPHLVQQRVAGVHPLKDAALELLPGTLGGHVGRGWGPAWETHSSAELGTRGHWDMVTAVAGLRMGELCPGRWGRTEVGTGVHTLQLQSVSDGKGPVNTPGLAATTGGLLAQRLLKASLPNPCQQPVPARPCPLPPPFCQPKQCPSSSVLCKPQR